VDNVVWDQLGLFYDFSNQTGLGPFSGSTGPCTGTDCRVVDLSPSNIQYASGSRNIANACNDSGLTSSTTPGDGAGLNGTGTLANPYRFEVASTQMSSARIVIPADSSFEKSRDTSFSTGVWIRFPTTNQGATNRGVYYMGSAENSGASTGFALVLGGAGITGASNRIGFWLGGSTYSDYAAAFTSASYNDNQWHYVNAVYTHTDHSIQIYVDGLASTLELPSSTYCTTGSLLSPTKAGFSACNFNPLHSGAGGLGGASSCCCGVSITSKTFGAAVVQFYHKALSSAEIIQNYCALRHRYQSGTSALCQ
jgi:hypothetical protein